MEREEESELIEACKALGNFQEANLVDQLTCQVKRRPEAFAKRIDFEKLS